MSLSNIRKAGSWVLTLLVILYYAEMISAVQSIDNRIKCPAPNTGPLAYKYNICYKFIRCANGSPWVFDCPPATVFNRDIGVCVHPSEYRKCTGSIPNQCD